MRLKGRYWIPTFVGMAEEMDCRASGDFTLTLDPSPVEGEGNKERRHIGGWLPMTIYLLTNALSGAILYMDIHIYRYSNI